MQIDLEQLTDIARQASQNAYAVYSQFRVGAAILADDGRVYPGCNVENASYGLTICAERTAVFSAIAAGCKEVRAVAIYTPTQHHVTPCGACRQVLAEFGKPDLPIWLASQAGDLQSYSLKQLLPYSFEF